jgi:hypothetical protein
LDTATLTTLVAQVYGGQSPDKVAQDWLTQEGLI